MTKYKLFNDDDFEVKINQSLNWRQKKYTYWNFILKVVIKVRDILFTVGTERLCNNCSLTPGITRKFLGVNLGLSQRVDTWLSRIQIFELNPRIKLEILSCEHGNYCFKLNTYDFYKARTIWYVHINRYIARFRYMLPRRYLNNSRDVIWVSFHCSINFIKVGT